MDATTAFKTVDRIIQQHEALVALKDCLVAAKNAERFVRESDDVIKRKKTEIAELDAAIEKRKADEAGIKNRGDEIIKNALMQAERTKQDSQRACNDDVARRNKELDEIAVKITDHRKLWSDVLAKLEATKAALVKETAALAKVQSERKVISDAIQKLAKGA